MTASTVDRRTALPARPIGARFFRVGPYRLPDDRRQAKSTTSTAQGSTENISSLSAVIRRNPTRIRELRCPRLGLWPRRPVPAALADFNKAIQLNPHFYQAYSNRALVERFIGDQSAALSDYNHSILINSTCLTSPLSAVAIFTAKPAAPWKAFATISRRPSSSTRRTSRLSQSRPDLSGRASTNSPSRISRPPSRWRRTQPNPTTVAASPTSP